MDVIKILFKIFKKWLPLAVAVTAIFGTIYAVVQQDYRQSANDPQIQIADDITEGLEAGAPVSSIIPSTYDTDISKSLSPFAIAFDDGGKVVASSGKIDGKTPEVPAGVFDFVRNHGEERLTWQPKEDVRIATVVKKYNKGFVLAGRSLREVEKRENQLLLRVCLAWVLTMGATLVTVMGLEFISLKLKKRG